MAGEASTDASEDESVFDAGEGAQGPHLRGGAEAPDATMLGVAPTRASNPIDRLGV
jgi:hypothetical protein